MKTQKEKMTVTNNNSGLASLLAETVRDNIVIIRNVPIIADADVAYLYGVETKRINEAVRNNPE